MTGSSWKGTPYIKSNNRVLKKRKASVAQRNQMLVFALASSWLRPMKEWIGLGYADAQESKLPMNAAISFVLREVVTGVGPDYQIDYSKMIWSRGILLMSVVTVFEVLTSVEPGEAPMVRIEWINAQWSFYNQTDDRAVFVFYGVERSEFLVFDQEAERGDSAAELQLPAGFMAGMVQGWMFYTRADAMVSTSVYLGVLA